MLDGGAHTEPKWAELGLGAGPGPGRGLEEAQAQNGWSVVKVLLCSINRNARPASYPGVHPMPITLHRTGVIRLRRIRCA